jgi:hypothetical protein
VYIPLNVNTILYIIDVGGFLDETAWWFITEGYAKRVIVFEPVYYDLCRSNVGDVAEVHPMAGIGVREWSYLK